MPDPQSDPNLSEEPIPLHQVLVEELNDQHPEEAIDLAKIETRRPYWQQQHSAIADPKERERAIESSLVGEFYQRLRRSGVERTALCLSGGGIRSATFCLGIVQGLARLKLLSQFDFLSTVSGGGYLGAWLSGWIEREGGSAARVEDELASRPQSPLEPEPGPVRHLRQYSRFLSPKTGLLSADTWTLVAIFLRNLFLNWLVLLPLLAAVLMLPRFGVVLAHRTPARCLQQTVFWIAVVAGVVAIAYLGANRPSLLNAEQRRVSAFRRSLRTQGGFLWLCLLPLAVMSIAATLYWAWIAPFSLKGLHFRILGCSVPAWGAFLLFGVLLHLGGFLGTLLLHPGIGRWRELVAALLTGSLGGLLAWFAAWFAAAHLAPPRLSAMSLLIYVCCAGPILLFLFLLAATFFIGLASNWMDDEDREWLARAGGWILIWIFARLALTALVFFGPFLFNWVGAKTTAAVGGLSGLVTLVLGYGVRTGSGPKQGGKAGGGEMASNLGLAFAAPLFALSLLVGLSALTSLLLRFISDLNGWNWRAEPGLPEHGFLDVVASAPGHLVLILAIALLGLGFLSGFFVDVNRFSLHAGYRDRLIRAYLGASRKPGTRKPNPFTGFDEADNLELRALTSNRPFHVVNAALNLVNGRDLALQDRKAESFTFSRLHCGYRGGYRKSAEYGRHRYGDARRLTLGTAFAISGAAASPNMGFHSSPAITFLLALFNVRLGWWLGNSGTAGMDTYRTPGPYFAPAALFAEAFGLTDDENRYIYLSDGGHFEDLGLYEMVLRRCRHIVVCDGSEDGQFTFEDLGNALARIRIDLGVPIEFEQGLPMRARPDLRGKSYDPTASKAKFPYFAVARIRYSCVDPVDSKDEEAEKDKIDGWLLYIKASLNNTEPADVFHYAKGHPTFPHESTGNQFFSEQQFESYRLLGSHSVDSITKDSVADLPELFKIARGAHK